MFSSSINTQCFKKRRIADRGSDLMSVRYDVSNAYQRSACENVWFDRQRGQFLRLSQSSFALDMFQLFHICKRCESRWESRWAYRWEIKWACMWDNRWGIVKCFKSRIEFHDQKILKQASYVCDLLCEKVRNHIVIEIEICEMCCKCW